MAKFKTRKGGATAREFLIGMVTNRNLIKSVAPLYDQDLFMDGDVRLISKWCISFYNKYDKAPNARILSKFENWAADRTERKDDLKENVNTLLSQISDEFANNDYSTEYLFDQAQEYLNQQRFRLIADVAESGTPEDKQRVFERYNRAIVLLPQMTEVSVLDMHDGIDWDDMGAPVFVWNDPVLDAHFNSTFRRGAFVQFQAPEKSGKTYWLLYVYYLAVTQGLNVAYFECGDLMKYEWLDRLAALHGGVMLQEPDENNAIDMMSQPSSIDNEGEVTRRQRKFKLLNKKNRRKILERFHEQHQGNYHFSGHVNSSLSVEAMSNTVSWMDRRPDVVVVDYADILLHSKEEKAGLDDTWKKLRAFSQATECCLVIASQADAAAYAQETQTGSNFSGSKGKNSHCSDIIGLNKLRSSDRQPVEGDVFLLQWLFRRHGPKDRNVYTAGNLNIGHPCMVSSFAGRQRKRRRE